MINTQLEKLVSLVLDAFVEGVPGTDEYRKNAFELQLRRKLMEKYCNVEAASTITTTLGTARISTGGTLLNG